MAKAKSAEGNGIEGVETALKTGFEQGLKNYEQMLGYSKDTVDAYLKAANAAGKGAESIQQEVYAYSKASIEDSIAAAKALMGTKSVHEAIELQTGYAKSAFEAYIGEVSKLSELFASTAKEAFEPIQGRVTAWMEVVQTARAA